MKKTTSMRSLQHNFVKVWTANSELSSGSGMSRGRTTSLPKGPAKATPEKQGFSCPSTTSGTGAKAFMLGLLEFPALITSIKTFLPTSTICHHMHNFHRQYSSASEPKADAGGLVQVELAQTGEGIADCELLRWFVQEGDEVDEFQPLCEVQSDKANVEITSRYKGKVTQVNFIPGDIVKVGEILLELMLEEGNSPTSAGPSDSNQPEDLSSDLSTESLSSGQAGKDIKTTPAVRHLAKNYAINLADVPGSGNDGRILKGDVLKFVMAKEELNEEMRAIMPDQSDSVHQSESSDSAEPSDSDGKLEGEVPKGHKVFSKDDGKLEGEVPKGHEVFSKEDPVGDVEVAIKPVADDLQGMDKIIPVRGIRRIMAKTMSAAVAVPHFHYTEDINVDALVQLKNSLKNVPLEQGVQLTYLPFLIKALSLALQKYPLMNSTVNQDASEITVRASHNVGVGMATSSGLVVPNIKNVQKLSVVEIAEELSRLSQLAATNKLCNEDVTGGTITVSNFGSIGGKYGSPILSLPEVAIVAIGRIQRLPHYKEDGSMYPANIMGVTWAADHRVIDGATVASFCNQWKLLIEQPGRFLLNMR